MTEWEIIRKSLWRERVRQSLSRAQLSVKMGVGKNSNLARWERGQVVPNAVSLIRWTTALGLKMHIIEDRRK